MAHFRGTVTGGRSEGSRCGHKTTGLTTTCNGWQSGVKVRAWCDETVGRDIFLVYASGGSGYSNSENKLIATVECKDGEIITTSTT